MKGVTLLKWIALGVTIWSLSLVWPDLNLSLTLPVIAGLVLVLTSIIGAYVLGYYHSQIDWDQRQRPENQQKHSSRPSRPVPPLSMA